ncbi:MAG: arsenate reductase ArsC [bacterium]|nr:MAG: arsenate reductase ArsC [bacterium]
MTAKKYKVLFLCTGNQARSQMAEALMRSQAEDRFDVHSAGSNPKTSVHPLAVEVLGEIGIDITGAVPKGMLEFIDERFDYVITLCDDARDTCPVFPGHPVSEHWNILDPAAAEGSKDDRLAAFRSARDVIAGRIDRFLESPPEH